jgi:hypothetical protein
VRGGTQGILSSTCAGRVLATLKRLDRYRLAHFDNLERVQVPRPLLVRLPFSQYCVRHKRQQASELHT